NEQMAVLTLYDHPDHIVVVDAHGFGPEVIGQRYAFGEGLGGIVAQTRKPSQTQHYSDFTGALPYYRSLGVQSAAAFPLVWQDRLIGTLAVCDPGQVAYNEDDMNMLGLYSSLVAAAIDQRRAMQELEAREVDALGEKHRVARAREEERLSIAEQLHDAIGFKLVELQKTAELAHADIHPDHPNFKRLQDVMSLLNTTKDMTQSLSGDLTSNALAELGLSAAIRQYLDRLKETTNANIHMHVVGRVKRLPDQVERIAYRGIQEAVINSLRHAQADRISIRMHYGAGMLRLNITDNGRGFATETNRGGGITSRSSSLGLPALQQQVEALNGVFHLHSIVGQGTSLEIELPFQLRAPQRANIKTRVVLVDRQEITRQGFHMLLAQSGDFTCVGEAADGLQALHQVELHRPDVIVMDMDLPNLSGAETAYQISKRFPAVHIMILASEGTTAQLQSAIRAGVHCYMLKSDGVDAIIHGLHLLRDGETCISEELIDAWQRQMSNQQTSDPQDLLTLREREVFQLVIAGNTNRVIGDRLGISYRTVEVHRKRIMTKFHVRNLAQLMQLVDKQSHDQGSGPIA
ncbi:MAG TPA: LuxR C-terminal-related transcriptional regulator, partial [Anaerolineae bacterium]